MVPQPVRRVFISYDSRTGMDYALKARSALRAMGIEAWVWDEDRQNGGYTLSEIVARLRDADFVLYICTEGTIASHGQEYEINTAIAGLKKRRPWVMASHLEMVPDTLCGYNIDVCELVNVAAHCERWVAAWDAEFPVWPAIEIGSIPVSETDMIPEKAAFNE